MIAFVSKLMAAPRGEGGVVHDHRHPLLITVWLLAANILVAGWAAVLVEDRRIPLAIAGVAYALGLKHALDADHIAAIDNVSRKLVGERRRPLLAGLCFSLGHSTVVLLATGAAALAGGAMAAKMAGVKSAGAVIGTTVSGGFLLLIAAINARSLWRMIAGPEQSHHQAPGKLFAWIGRPLFGLITRSWHMYPLGLLFGLGFDTASEIALLALATTQAGRSTLGWQVLVFPALFTAGMSLIDTADGLLAARAYAWALDDPERTRRYNIMVTLVSILAAFGIGCAQLSALATGLDPLSDLSGWIGGGLCVVLATLWFVVARIHKAAARA